MSNPVERLAEHIGWIENETEPYKPTSEDLRLAGALRTILAKYREVEDPELGEDWVVKDVLAEVIELLADAVNPEENTDA